MIIIRELMDKDILQAIQLKALCWPEELAGMADNNLDIDKEYSFWIDWMYTGIENSIRIRKLQHAIVSLLEGQKVIDVTLLYSFDSHEGFTRSFTHLFGSTPRNGIKYKANKVSKTKEIV